VKSGNLASAAQSAAVGAFDTDSCADVVTARTPARKTEITISKGNFFELFIASFSHVLEI
jgi:hypothetical protein